MGSKQTRDTHHHKPFTGACLWRFSFIMFDHFLCISSNNSYVCCQGQRWSKLGSGIIGPNRHNACSSLGRVILKVKSFCLILNSSVAFSGFVSGHSACWRVGIWVTWAHFLSLARSKLRPCSANHRPGYWCNLPCDWPSTAWAYSEQETENGPWVWILASPEEDNSPFESRSLPWARAESNLSNKYGYSSFYGQGKMWFEDP